MFLNLTCVLKKKLSRLVGIKAKLFPKLNTIDISLVQPKIRPNLDSFFKNGPNSEHCQLLTLPSPRCRDTQEEFTWVIILLLWIPYCRLWSFWGTVRSQRRSTPDRTEWLVRSETNMKLYKWSQIISQQMKFTVVGNRTY